MLGHLTENQIEGYGRQKLSAAELLSVSDHLGDCETCREQVQKAMGGDASFFALRSEVFDPTEGIAFSQGLWTHLTVEQIADYVDGMPTGDDLTLVKDHLTSCEQCAVAVTDLRAFKSQVAPRLNREYHPASVPTTLQSWTRRLLALLPSPFLRSPWVFSSALAVLLLMVIGWLVWRAQQKKETEVVITAPPTFTPQSSPSLTTTRSPIPAPEAAPVIAELNDGDGPITLDRDGKLSGVDNLPTAYQRMVRESLTNQRLTQSPLLVGLNRPASSLMGVDEEGNTFSVTEPVGKVTLSDRPTFRWSQLEGATGYIVEIYDNKFNLVTSSSPLSGVSWTAPQPLKGGEVYSWQVKAIKDGREFRSPRPPSAQAKFRILDVAKMNELTKAQRAYASSHLALGLLYLEAGQLDQAEKEFRALQKANPDSELVRGLVSQLEKLRR